MKSRNLPFALPLILVLSACQGLPPVPKTEMLPLANVITDIPSNTSLERVVELRNIEVSKDASMHGQIDPAVVREAMQYSLLTANYAVRGQTPATYSLDIHMLKMELPSLIDHDCYPTILYTLQNRNTGKTYTETVKTHYDAPWSDGDARWHNCLGRSIRENITHYLRLLSAKPKNFFSGNVR